MWLDYDISKEKSRNYFYASNLAPLWTGSYDNKLSEYYGDAAVDYLIKNNIINNDLTPRYLCEFHYFTFSYLYLLVHHYYPRCHFEYFCSFVWCSARRCCFQSCLPHL